MRTESYTPPQGDGIEEALINIPILIEKKSEEVTNKRKDYQTAKATYEYKYHQTILNCKIVNPKSTQSDLKAKATINSQIERLEMITKESEYRKAITELTRLRDDFDAAKERSYNYRQELKRFQG